MIELNLLPPEEKNLIATQAALRKILEWGSRSFVSILFFLVLLSSIWSFLVIQLKSFEAISKEVENSPQGKAFGAFKEEIDEANQRLQYLDWLQSKTRNYSFALERLTELVPGGIKVEKISINEKGVILEGHATTRQTLLSFKEALEKSVYFEKVDSPLSDFLKQRDINFSFNFQIK